MSRRSVACGDWSGELRRPGSPVDVYEGSLASSVHLSISDPRGSDSIEVTYRNSLIKHQYPYHFKVEFFFMWVTMKLYQL